MGNILTLYHNTTNINAIKINKEGIKGGMRLQAYGKGSEAEGAGIWCSTVRGYGYGGATITFQIDNDDETLTKQNDTEYIVYRDVKPDEIIDIDLMVSSVPSVQGHTTTVESDIPNIINKFGKDKILNVFKKNESKFVFPYNYDTFINLIETGNKYCKGTTSLTENNKLEESKSDNINQYIEDKLNDGTSWDMKTKLEWVRQDVYKYIRLIGRKINNAKYDYERNMLKKDQDFYKEVLAELDNRLKKKKIESKKLEEASRNELLAKSKAETITRYNKSAGYKGFSLVDIDTTAIKTRNTLVITNRVGDYFDTVELEDILYWVGLEVDETRDKKMGLEPVRRALLNAMDAMNIKVDCNCGDFVYRFAYMASVLEYKYGKPENRPSNITNPNGYGAMCFVKDTEVFTPKGLIPIQDLKIGNEVYTHTGQIKKVTNIGSRPVDHTLRMKIGTEYVECTDEHPFLSCNSSLKDIKWTSADNLSLNKFVLSPIIKHNGGIKVPDNYAFMLGLFLADGNIGYRADIKDKDVLESNIRIAADNRFKEQYDNLFNSFGFDYSYNTAESTDSGSYTLLGNTELRDFIIKHGGFNYKNRGKKFLSDEVFDWSGEDKKELLRGFFAGDGQYGSNGTTLNMNLLNTNLELLWRLNLIARSLGIHTRWNVLSRKPRMIEGRQIDNVKDMGYIAITGKDTEILDTDFLHSIKYEKSQDYKASDYKAREIEFENTRYFLNGVKEMELVEEPNTVYNITVEDDESYLITREGLAVHNCKHLIALLSNKSWIKQVASTLQQWIIDEIDWVRKFLKVTEEEFQLPDEYARQLGRHGAMKKFWDKQPDAEIEDEEPQEDNDEANEVGESDIENNEATDNTSEEEEKEETPTLDNKANMPKVFRNNNQGDEELEEK